MIGCRDIVSSTFDLVVSNYSIIVLLYTIDHYLPIAGIRRHYLLLYVAVYVVGDVRYFT
jgi:hypothetical protein